MAQDKETLREAVARAIDACDPDRIDHALCLKQADAAIATMFERLRTPSEGMIEASKPFRKGVGEAAGRLWQAMLDKFEQEDMARTTCTHEWEYTGTDHHGTHKGEAAYRCQKCKAFEYRT